MIAPADAAAVSDPVATGPLPLSHWLSDLRPDLPQDSAAWVEVFRVEYPRTGADPAGMYGTARGLRCLGVRLRQNASGGWRLAPPPDMDHDELEALAGEHLTGLVAGLSVMELPA